MWQPFLLMKNDPPKSAATDGKTRDPLSRMIKSAVSQVPLSDSTTRNCQYNVTQNPSDILRTPQTAAKVGQSHFRINSCQRPFGVQNFHPNRFDPRGSYIKDRNQIYDNQNRKFVEDFLKDRPLTA